jgi:heme/copper-type cytochrome/quinol oxidase subunit 1
MAQIILNSAAAILIAAAFITTARQRFACKTRMQKVPVRVRNRHYPNG